MRRVKWVAWSILFVLVVLMLMAGKFNNDGLALFLFFCAVVWWFTGGIFSRWIVAACVSSVRCKGCGLEIPAVGRWAIGSFTDHRERHFALAKNPIDGSRIGHTNCPQCDTTILL